VPNVRICARLVKTDAWPPGSTSPKMSELEPLPKSMRSTL
jgi:hypothetical protein